MSDLDDIMKKLNHDFGANTIISGDEIIAMEIERIPTGSLALDIETGGGYPCGRVIELFGRESAGKSFMALKAVAEAQKLGKVAVWIDVERENTTANGVALYDAAFVNAILARRGSSPSRARWSRPRRAGQGTAPCRPSTRCAQRRAGRCDA